jgi:cell division protease FtsH
VDVLFTMPSAHALLDTVRDLLFALAQLVMAWIIPILFAVLVYISWRMLRMMPNTKPVEIAPRSDSAVAWDDVAGVDEARAELQEVVEFLRHPGRFEKLGARVPHGVLLYGPPGTGKTLLAKAIAHESGATFYFQSASAFVEMFVGVGAARIRRLFSAARKHQPAIIFIDELDAVGSQRSGGPSAQEHNQTLNQLLVELDGFDESERLVVIGASNRLQDLDPALLRPGRFDRHVSVSPPDLRGREQILSVHTREKPLGDDVDLHEIARRTSGLTGADLANLANEAAIFAGRAGREQITRADFDDALERVVAGLQQRKLITDKEKRVIAYHEAGHALVARLMGDAMQLHKVTIVPRGQALGYTLNLPEEDRHLQSTEELRDWLKVILAGRAAEQVVFGRITNGAANDLDRATQIARAMVFEWGMGASVPHLQVRADDYALSEETKRLRDGEQRAITDAAYRDALALVERHRPYLDKLAQALLAQETLDRPEIDRLLEGLEPESNSSLEVGVELAPAPPEANGRGRVAAR